MCVSLATATLGRNATDKSRNRRLGHNSGAKLQRFHDPESAVARRYWPRFGVYFLVELRCDGD